MTRFAMWFPPFDKELGFKVVDALCSMGSGINATPSQISLAWLLKKPGVTSIIIGARNMDQLKDNLKAMDVKLDEQSFNKLENLTVPKPIYPEWMIGFQGQDRLPKK
ncbi:MAG: aldo/keto reductase [Deltaproteobacteria bacterium]|nr:aldo/keto reductase [Deltaproteobacteria bacterium]